MTLRTVLVRLALVALVATTAVGCSSDDDGTTEAGTTSSETKSPESSDTTDSADSAEGDSTETSAPREVTPEDQDEALAKLADPDTTICDAQTIMGNITNIPEPKDANEAVDALEFNRDMFNGLIGLLDGDHKADIDAINKMTDAMVAEVNNGEFDIERLNTASAEIYEDEALMKAMTSIQEGYAKECADQSDQTGAG